MYTHTSAPVPIRCTEPQTSEYPTGLFTGSTSITKVETDIGKQAFFACKYIFRVIEQKKRYCIKEWRGL